MASVFIREVCLRRFCLLWVNCDTSNEVSVLVGGAWYVLPPGGEDGSFCIVGAKDNGQLSVINPSLFPIDFWLIGSEPWIPEYGFLFSYMRQEESKLSNFASCLHLKVSVMLQLSTNVLRVVNIE